MQMHKHKKGSLVRAIKTQTSTWPLFLYLPPSIKYACCKEKEIIFILFSQASPRKQTAQNCFPQLLQEMQALCLKSNQHCSIKNFLFFQL